MANFVLFGVSTILPVLYTKLQLNFVDFIKTALPELSVILMYVEVPRAIFCDIKRTSGSVQFVTYSMIAFVSIATLLWEHDSIHS
jgi:hypothetical protein